MKNFSTAYAAHLQQRSTTLAICWKVVKNNGEEILGTTHDRPITISATSIGGAFPTWFSLEGTYLAASGIVASDIVSSADMSVSNMDVSGSVKPDLSIIKDITVRDIESGVLDSAIVTTFRVNWTNPDDFQEVLRHGTLGNIPRDSDGRYQTEVRGLAQVLQQTIGRTCGDRCDVKVFGDARCKYPVDAQTRTATVTAVTSRRRFDVSYSGSPVTAGFFVLGKVTFTSGENDGFVGQTKDDDVGGTVGHVELWEPMPFDIEVGDTLTMAPGCDRLYPTCKNVFNNLVNFRGPGYFTPGMDQIMRAP